MHVASYDVVEFSATMCSVLFLIVCYK